MDKEKRRKITGILLAIFVFSLCLTPQFQSFFSLPSEQKISVGDKLVFPLKFPKQVLNNLSVYVDSEREILKLNGNSLIKNNFGFNMGTPVAVQPGKANVQLRLFGLIPIRKMTVEVVPRLKVVPGGHSIGVLLQSQGVIVVGYSIITDEKGMKHNPAKEVGIKVGDTILKINGHKVDSDEDVAKYIDEAGAHKKVLRCLIKRNKRKMIKTFKPIYCKETGRYRIGLYIRDSAAGVGTMTFYDPKSGKYGALGHVITDTDTNLPIDLGGGKIVKAMIQGIQEGRRGIPGEKVGMFLDNDQFQGNIEKNTRFGIFGSLKNNIENPLYPKPLPIALANQIKEGPAQILTVIEGDKIENFDIEIQKVFPQVKADSKGLILKITDKRLIDKTGGIIQGMSGSPIIQDGKIVGAVTHVFINDPTRGYGILIEWMLHETGLEKTKNVTLHGSIAPFYL